MTVILYEPGRSSASVSERICSTVSVSEPLKVSLCYMRINKTHRSLHYRLFLWENFNMIFCESTVWIKLSICLSVLLPESTVWIKLSICLSVLLPAVFICLLFLWWSDQQHRVLVSYNNLWLTMSLRNFKCSLAMTHRWRHYIDGGGVYSLSMIAGWRHSLCPCQHSHWTPMAMGCQWHRVACEVSCRTRPYNRMLMINAKCSDWLS